MLQTNILFRVADDSKIIKPLLNRKPMIGIDYKTIKGYGGGDDYYSSITDVNDIFEHGEYYEIASTEEALAAVIREMY